MSVANEVKTRDEPTVRLWVLEPNGGVTTYGGSIEKALEQAGTMLAEAFTVITPGGDHNPADLFYVRTSEDMPDDERIQGFITEMTEGGRLRVMTPRRVDVVAYGPTGWLEMHTNQAKFKKWIQA